MHAANGADHAVYHCTMTSVYGMASTIPLRGLVILDNTFFRCRPRPGLEFRLTGDRIFS